jgi:hypothetical protein
MAIALKIVESSNPWAATLGKLSAIEKRVVSADREGMTRRWEYGQLLLAKREEYKGRKVVPKDLREAALAQDKIGPRELVYRVRFAEKFPTRELMSTALHDWPTWTQMKEQGLVTKKRAKRSAVKKLARLVLKQFRTQLHGTHAADLTAADLKDLDAIQEEIARIYDELTEKG